MIRLGIRANDRFGTFSAFSDVPKCRKKLCRRIRSIGVSIKICQKRRAIRPTRLKYKTKQTMTWFDVSKLDGAGVRYRTCRGDLKTNYLFFVASAVQTTRIFELAIHFNTYVVATFKVVVSTWRYVQFVRIVRNYSEYTCDFRNAMRNHSHRSLFGFTLNTT